MNQLRHKLTLLSLVCMATIGALLAGCVTRSSEKPKRVDVSKLPARFQVFFATNQVPIDRSELLTLVSAKDLPQLHHLFPEIPLSDRGNLVLTLGMIGDRTSVSLLTNAFTDKLSGVRLDGASITVLLQSLNSLGHLSGKSPEAFDFLKQGVEEEFWRAQRKWTAPINDDTVNITLAKQSL